MFCYRCGRQIADDIKFCPHCGAATLLEQKNIYPPMDGPVGGYAPAPVQTEEEKAEKPSIRSGLGLAITLSSISLVMWSLLSLITGVIGIIFAALAKGKCAAGNLESAKAKVRVSKAMNITTIILLILWVIMIVALIVFAVQATADVVDAFETMDIYGMSAQELDNFLQEYGYNYDIEVLEEYLEYNFGTVAR